MKGMNKCHMLSDILAFAADSAKEQVAIRHGNINLNYENLLKYTESYSNYLVDNGVLKGDCIIILLENSIEYIVALFGIFHAGATAIPLNPDTKAESVFATLEHSKARGIITRETVFRRISTKNIELPIITLFSTDYEKNINSFFNKTFISNNRSLCHISEQDLALVLYTSGTTGSPKGVMLTHKNLLENTCSIVEYLKLTSQDSIVNVLPFFYSFGNSILLTHLAVQGRIIIENRFMYPNSVIQTMQTEKPSGFSGVPSTYYILLQKTDFLKQDWNFLRYISQAGGGMRCETIKSLAKALPATDIYIMYGQTEASARLSYLQPELLKSKTGSIGKGIPGVELKVVDEQGNNAPVNEIGEIIARGNNIMLGYFEDPKKTSTALRDGWLYTRDMARRDEEGFIYIINRKSDFIKSAAYRISPFEIEETIATAEGVQDVAVIGVYDELLGEAIAACITCSEKHFDIQKFRNNCLEKLPVYKVPKYFLFEPNIPMTASGKKRYNVLREKHQNCHREPS
jgi:long-chain acyl-CoA synthetase